MRQTAPPTTPPTLRNQNGSCLPKEKEASFVKMCCWRPYRSFTAPRRWFYFIFNEPREDSFCPGVAERSGLFGKKRQKKLYR